MAFFTSNPLHPQTHLCSITFRMSPCTFNNSFKFHFPSFPLTFSPPKHPPRFSPLLIVRTPCGHIDTQLTATDQETLNETSNGSNHVTISSGVSQSSANGVRVGRKYRKKTVSSSVVGETPETNSATRDADTGKEVDSSDFRGPVSMLSNLFLESVRKCLEKNVTGSVGSTEDNRERDEKNGKGFVKQFVVDKRKKGDKKSKVNPMGGTMKASFDRCSEKGDFLGALILYDSSLRKHVKVDQWLYTGLLYLCSSAATGVVEPAKSGSGGRSLSSLDPISGASPYSKSEVMVKLAESFSQWEHLDSSDLEYGLTEEGKNKILKDLATVDNGKPNPQVKDSTKLIEHVLKEYALVRGFEIFHRMCREEVPMNEASLTSVARMCMVLGDGDMAFFVVKQMKLHGINPGLRSYGPALSAFCTSRDVDKAFSVEQHMLEHGVYPEEPELEALLKVSIEACRSDKVYYLLHRLRTRVGKVSPSTAVLLEKWFTNKAASKVGKRKVDERLIKEAIKNGGGGWHGQGWLGKGKWNVLRTSVGTDGLCKCCGQILATIDLDPVETEKFAESVASLTAQREKNSSFQQFQKWLDYSGPFEAVVDGANVGVLPKRKLQSLKQGLEETLTRVNAVVNGVRSLLPSKKWPLVVLHSRHVTGYPLEKPACKELIDKWKTADALYATPTWSNDDWYWLYAAIKCKCLIVTNDEMRDHLFHLLGNDFFPKWKERHQVRFSFSDVGPVIHMPPPYSTVIQESQKGHWHIPIASEHDNKGERTWLCITRGKSPGSTHVTATMHEDNHSPGTTQVTATIHEGNHSTEATQATTTIHTELQSPVYSRGSDISDTRTKTEAPILMNDIMNIMKSVPSISKVPSILKDPTILRQIEAAEERGGCVIDFEI